MSAFAYANSRHKNLSFSLSEVKERYDTKHADLHNRTIEQRSTVNFTENTTVQMYQFLFSCYSAGLFQSFAKIDLPFKGLTAELKLSVAVHLSVVEILIC